MAWAFVTGQAVHTVAGPTAAATTAALPAFASSSPIGNRILVVTSIWDCQATSQANVSGVTDSAGNTYTQLANCLLLNVTCLTTFAWWTAPVTASGTLTLTLTFSKGAAGGGNTGIGATAVEYSGLSTAAGLGCVDVSANSVVTGTAGAIASGNTAVTTAANELVWGAYADTGTNGTVTITGGFTQRDFSGVDATGTAQLMVEDADSGASGGVQAASATANGAAGHEMAIGCFVFKNAVLPLRGPIVVAASSN